MCYRYRVIDGAWYTDDGDIEIPEGEKMPSFGWYIPRLSVMTMYNTLEVVKRESNNS